MVKDINGNFSATLLLGMLAKNIPLKVWQPFLQKSIDVMNKKYPRVFHKVKDEQTGNSFDFVIDAIDLPFLFYMKPSPEAPILMAFRRGEDVSSSAVIKGELVNLLKMFEGKVDGDAAFFSKTLVIQGSTVAVLALRNAIDSEDMNIIEDLSDVFVPFQKYFKLFSSFAIKRYNSFQNNLDIISDAITQKNTEEIKNQETKINGIYEELDDIHKVLDKINKEEIRKKSDYKQI
jgi:predicted lipid carrier protein YhbT